MRFLSLKKKIERKKTTQIFLMERAQGEWKEGAVTHHREREEGGRQTEILRESETEKGRDREGEWEGGERGRERGRERDREGGREGETERERETLKNRGREKERERDTD